MNKCFYQIHKGYRIVVILISLIMILGMFVPMTSSAVEEEKTTNENQSVIRRTDSSTINNWKKFFGDEMGTTNAGKIWMDKTVSDGDIVLESADSTDPITTIEKQDEDNFLVGLSALSSNQSVVGESSLPVDVMFVVDISDSMGNMIGGRIIIESVIEALNIAIESILKNNVENRIGVVLYSGADGSGVSSENSAVTLMPLDYYTAESGKFVDFIDDSKIKVNEHVKNSKGELFNPDNGHLVMGFTYIQNGLLEALETFKNGKLDDNKRVPILTLLSDGAPTTAREKYAEKGDSTIGEGENTDLCKVLLTQLTAAWVKANLQEIYIEQKPQFYTIGILDKDEEEYEYAQMIMKPSEYTESRLDEYWNTFFSLQQGESITYIPQSGDLLNQNVEIKKADDKITSRYYEDKSFETTNHEEIKDAFAGIVEQVQSQSLSYPTDVKENDPNYSGYLHFQDRIGEYMSVEQINGIMYNGKLQNGSAFARRIIRNEGIEAFLNSAIILVGIVI